LVEFQINQVDLSLQGKRSDRRTVAPVDYCSNEKPVDVWQLFIVLILMLCCCVLPYRGGINIAFRTE
jgi:hypothetical protein